MRVVTVYALHVSRHSEGDFRRIVHARPHPHVVARTLTNLARNIQGGDYPKDAKDDASTRRRSVYMFHKRLVPYPSFQAFDRPDFLVSCARRQNTTVAPQAMALLNDRFVRAVALDFAKRLIEVRGDDDQRLVQELFELSFSRLPTVPVVGV